MPLNYAFMPAYPFAMRTVAAPARVRWGCEPPTAAAIAGVAVSLGAALVAMLALFSLARPPPGRCRRRPRRVLPAHLPDRFFLAQVYSEAFFLAASFGALASMADRRPLAGGLLASSRC